MSILLDENVINNANPLPTKDVPDLTLGAVSMTKTLAADGTGSVVLPAGTTTIGLSVSSGATVIRAGLEAPEAAVANTFKKGFIVPVGSYTYLGVPSGSTLYFLGANGQTVDITCVNA